MKSFRQAHAFVRRKDDNVVPPREWMLEVTNRCNLACPMCSRDKAAFAIRDMDLTFLDKLLEEEDSLPEAVWPYGFGESLMHPQLPEIFRRVKRKGIVLSLSTNATLLNARTAEKLIDSGLDYLILAIDGATKQTYAKYRKGAQFEQVVENVEQFLALKIARRSSIHVTVQMILMRDNSSEISDFRRMWNRKGVNRVRLREDLSKFPEISDEGRPQEAHRPCFFLWRGPLFIQAAGTVIPCPYYHGAEPSADLNFQSVEEAWNSRTMVELRRAHADGDLSSFPICARCPRYQPHPILAAISFFVGTRFIRRLLPFAEGIQRRAAWKMLE